MQHMQCLSLYHLQALGVLCTDSVEKLLVSQVFLCLNHACVCYLRFNMYLCQHMVPVYEAI